VEVGGGAGDVAKRGHFEEAAVGEAVGDGGAAGIKEARVRLGEAELLEAGAAEQRTSVAEGAAGGEELIEALFFGDGEGGAVALEEAVPAGGGEERALEGGEGAGDVGERERLFVLGEGLGEEGRVGGAVLKNLDDGLLAGEAHFDGVEERAGGLRFERGGAAIPELGEVQGGVEDGGRVARAAAAVDAGRGGLAVGAGAGERMAGVAADAAGAGEAGFEEEAAAQADEGRVLLFGRRQGGEELQLGFGDVDEQEKE